MKFLKWALGKYGYTIVRLKPGDIIVKKQKLAQIIGAKIGNIKKPSKRRAKIKKYLSSIGVFVYKGQGISGENDRR